MNIEFLENSVPVQILARESELDPKSLAIHVKIYSSSLAKTSSRPSKSFLLCFDLELLLLPLVLLLPAFDLLDLDLACDLESAPYEGGGVSPLWYEGGGLGVLLLHWQISSQVGAWAQSSCKYSSQWHALLQPDWLLVQLKRTARAGTENKRTAAGRKVLKSIVGKCGDLDCRSEQVC